jgi:hypothetical protein
MFFNNSEMRYLILGHCSLMFLIGKGSGFGLKPGNVANRFDGTDTALS